MSIYGDMPQDIYSALRERVAKGPVPAVSDGGDVIYEDRYVKVTARLRAVKVEFARFVDWPGRPAEVPSVIPESVTFVGPVGYQLGQVMRQRYEAAEAHEAAVRVAHLRQTLKDY